MLNCRTYLLLLLLPLVQSCMQQRVNFVFNEHVNSEEFFNVVPAEIKRFYPDSDIAAIDSIKIYVANFKETYIEDNYLLEWSELHDSSTIPRARYLNMVGNATRLYLCTISTSPKDIQAAVFFSAKYDAEGQCLGFGPSYLGKINPAQGTIAFTTELAVRESGESFQLEVTRKQNRKAGVIFTSHDFRDILLHARKPVRVDKIVLLDPNKIGGFKPVVFSIDNVLKDKNALLFRYLKTIH